MNGITVNGVHSYYGLGLYINTRKISLPERKAITATIPYMSGYYDFSGIYGDIAYGARTLEYTFDIMEDTPEEVEATKNRVYSWARAAQETEIYDDYDPNYYFIGSFTSAEYTEDENLPDDGGQIKITFTAQPYRYERSTGEAVI